MSDDVSEQSDERGSKLTAEITVRVVVLGLILSVVMGAANVYVGLKAGMTVSASIPAAVMAMLLFRLFFKNSTILEANQVQTCASAGESLAAGIIFTMPAMILIGHWTEFDFWTVTLVAFTGGLLGILFMIPMRKVFVVDNCDLKFPEGVACATVLHAGESGKEDSAGTSLIVGGVLGGVVKLAGGFMGLISGSLETAGVFGSRVLYFGGDLSPMLIAVGFIVRLNVAILIFIGGALAWLIGIPLLGGALAGDNAVDQAYGLWSTEIRYVGVGAMVVGGFSALISVRHGLVAAIAHLWRGISSDQNTKLDDVDRDIPSWAIVTLGSVCVFLLAMVNYWFTNNVPITILATLVMLVMGFFFTAVASYIVGLVGNSNSPVSGMTITAVLVAGALLYLANYTGMDGMVATLGIAAIVCCVACTSGDVCNDLKTGSLVGASPFRQQMMQIAGVFVAAFVMAPVLTLLHEHGGGIGSKELSAPQAGLFASLAKGFAGESELPWMKIGIGAGLGFAILLIDETLKRRGAKFRAHLMPIAVGMYLPFGLAIPILLGGLIAHFHSKDKPESEHDAVLHRGVLFSSGVIAGEALTAVGIAGLAAIGIRSLELGVSPGMVTGISCVTAALIVIVYVVMSKPLSQTNR